MQMQGAIRDTKVLKGLELSTKIPPDLVMMTDSESCLFIVTLISICYERRRPITPHQAFNRNQLVAN